MKDGWLPQSVLTPFDRPNDDTTPSPYTTSSPVNVCTFMLWSSAFVPSSLGNIFGKSKTVMFELLYRHPHLHRICVSVRDFLL